MRQSSHSLTIGTQRQGLVEITHPVTAWIDTLGYLNGC
jgi:thiamine phosphate synthase YjbQ (UPF0047 family)